MGDEKILGNSNSNNDNNDDDNDNGADAEKSLLSASRAPRPDLRMTRRGDLERLEALKAKPLVPSLPQRMSSPRNGALASFGPQDSALPGTSSARRRLVAASSSGGPKAYSDDSVSAAAATNGPRSFGRSPRKALAPVDTNMGLCLIAERRRFHSAENVNTSPGASDAPDAKLVPMLAAPSANSRGRSVSRPRLRATAEREREGCLRQSVEGAAALGHRRQRRSSLSAPRRRPPTELPSSMTAEGREARDADARFDAESHASVEMLELHALTDDDEGSLAGKEALFDDFDCDFVSPGSAHYYMYEVRGRSCSRASAVSCPSPAHISGRDGDHPSDTRDNSLRSAQTQARHRSNDDADLGAARPCLRLRSRTTVGPDPMLRTLARRPRDEAAAPPREGEAAALAPASPSSAPRRGARISGRNPVARIRRKRFHTPPGKGTSRSDGGAEGAARLRPPHVLFALDDQALDEPRAASASTSTSTLPARLDNSDAEIYLASPEFITPRPPSTAHSGASPPAFRATMLSRPSGFKSVVSKTPDPETEHEASEDAKVSPTLSRHQAHGVPQRHGQNSPLLRSRHEVGSRAPSPTSQDPPRNLRSHLSEKPFAADDAVSSMPSLNPHDPPRNFRGTPFENPFAGDGGAPRQRPLPHRVSAPAHGAAVSRDMQSSLPFPSPLRGMLPVSPRRPSPRREGDASRRIGSISSTLPYSPSSASASSSSPLHLIKAGRGDRTAPSRTAMYDDLGPPATLTGANPANQTPSPAPSPTMETAMPSPAAEKKGDPYAVDGPSATSEPTLRKPPSLLPLSPVPRRDPAPSRATMHDRIPQPPPARDVNRVLRLETKNQNRRLGRHQYRSSDFSHRGLRRSADTSYEDENLINYPRFQRSTSGSSSTRENHHGTHSSRFASAGELSTKAAPGVNTFRGGPRLTGKSDSLAGRSPIMMRRATSAEGISFADRDRPQLLAANKASKH